jgi:iron complex transport system ATP-binding protein
MSAAEPAMNTPLLEARRLKVDIGGHSVCRHLDWRVDAGESWAILGRNGVGKSTLLATLAGFRAQQGGDLSIAGLASPHLSQGEGLRAMARVRGYLSQHQFDPFASTVMETVLVGRHPHLGRWDWESAADRRIAEAALDELYLDGFAEREVQTLSGGERQRLAVAQLLTQEPQLFLLDEPLTHLDLSHQVAVMEMFARRASKGAAIVAVLHDPGFAARYCSQALLLFGDGEWLAGTASDVITETSLTRLYGHPLRELCADGQRWFVPC